MSSNSAQALANELKGHLFEFLLAQKISQFYQQEYQFINQIDSATMDRLLDYQQQIQAYDQKLFLDLQRWAELGASYLCRYFPFKPPLLSSKMLGKSEQGAEADLLFQFMDSVCFLSVKLSKFSAYVNTKSGGAKTFLANYLLPYLEEHDRLVVTEAQLQVVKISQQHFWETAYLLHDLRGFEFRHLPEEQDLFSSWIDQGAPVLPGELSDEEKQILYQYYQRITEYYGNFFQAFFSHKNRDLAAKSWLMNLLGLSDQHLYQFYFFADTEQMLLIAANQIKQKLDPKLWKFSFAPNRLSFYIDFNLGQLQIRPKPMNVFTSPALKINCSVKWDQKALASL